MYEVKICHLYPDLMNLYGDRGNIIAMRRRLEWRGVEVAVDSCAKGQRLDPKAYDIFFIGGGQDFEQGILLNDVAAGKGEAITEAVELGKVFLAICGGYQLLGKYYDTWDGRRMNFIGALDLCTKGERGRMIGDYMFECTPESGGSVVVAFENHSGRTYLGEGVRPLGRVLSGFGNNGGDGTEGARYKNVFCSYGHGPLLPKNPELCDELLLTALRAKYPDFELKPLDDGFENAANAYMRARLEAARS